MTSAELSSASTFCVELKKKGTEGAWVACLAVVRGRECLFFKGGSKLLAASGEKLLKARPLRTLQLDEHAVDYMPAAYLTGGKAGRRRG